MVASPDLLITIPHSSLHCLLPTSSTHAHRCYAADFRLTWRSRQTSPIIELSRDLGLSGRPCLLVDSTTGGADDGSTNSPNPTPTCACLPRHFRFRFIEELMSGAQRLMGSQIWERGCEGMALTMMWRYSYHFDLCIKLNYF